MKNIIILSLYFLVTSVTLFSQDMSKMSAVELNTAGFNLYEQGKFQESLVYFEASFQKDYNYVHPHYNYACVLSILIGKGLRESYDSDSIKQHLLISFKLKKEYMTKWLSDEDLVWYRSNRAQSDGLLDIDKNVSLSFVQNTITSAPFYIATTSGISIILAEIDFADDYRFSGVLFSPGSDSDLAITGTYTIIGNLLCLSFNDQYPCYNGAFGYLGDIYILVKPSNDFNVLWSENPSIDYFSTERDLSRFGA